MFPIVKFCKLTSRLRLYTRVNHVKNSPVFSLQGETFKCRYRIHGAIQLSEDEYILDSFGQYMNHSSNPTSAVINRSVIATRDLNPGDELTYDKHKSVVYKEPYF